jgi:hypothetical protein
MSCVYDAQLPDCNQDWGQQTTADRDLHINHSATVRDFNIASKDSLFNKIQTMFDLSCSFDAFMSAWWRESVGA